MRRVIVAVAAVTTLYGGLTVATSSAAADPPVCLQYDTHGLCTVWAHSSGSEGRNGGGNGGTSTCMNGQQPVPCDYNGGWWSNWMSCYVKAVSPQPPLTDPMWSGHTTGGVYYCAAYNVGYPIPQTGQGWFWLPRAPTAVDPAVLAQEALDTLTIPPPQPGRYPAGTLRDGTPYTVVRAETWYWTGAATWQTLTARASAGAVWAQVTVTPSRLTFTPGNGSPAVGCAGPGSVWQASDGPWASSPSGCQYSYAHTSINDPGQVVMATYGIEWTVTWTGSGGASGTLTIPPTTATATFAVAEVQAVVTH
jgi:hypothetical protein